MSRQILLRYFFVLLFLVTGAIGQETLTNEGVMNLVKSGMSEDLILNVIGRQPAAFSLAAADLVALKTSGVSERIISAMVNKGTGGPGSPGPNAAPAAVPDKGLHYKKNNEYFELLSEDVNWKSSGAFKSFASAGIIKKDLKGGLNGISSPNFLQAPVEIVISPPAGLSISDYVLLPLRPDKNERQFEVGPVNKKDGVSKGAIQFGVEKIGPNAFRLVFTSPLGPGEYGILTAKSVGGVAGSASRMYTFRLRT